MNYFPHDYQKYCQDKIIEIPYIGLFLDMGLGKTVIALTAIHELKYYRFAVRRALVIAPKKVAEATWSKEAAKWDHLAALRVSTVLGTAAQRSRALDTEADVYVTNRDNTKWVVDYYTDLQHPERVWPFDVVVLDESSSFKNHRAVRFRAMRAIRPKIKRLILLTGTPTPHGLTDLWAQIYLLDGGKRLGRTVSTYRDIFFVPDKRNASTIWSYKIKDGASETIYNLISDICISMAASDYLTLPDCIYQEIPVVLDAKAQAIYDRLERDTLLQVDPETWITAGTAGVLTGKLLQLCDGAVYDETGKAVVLHDCKIEAFRETVEQLNGQHALVFYNFRHDRTRLLEVLTTMKAAGGRELHVRVYESAADEADWNAGMIDVLLAHPASCAYGLNLQQGGHHIIWFGLTWSLEQYQQANKRLHRQGQACPVIIHHLIVQGGIDDDVMRALSGKENTQKSLLEALKVRLEKAKKGCTQT